MQLQEAHETAKRDLLNARHGGGYWEGELASSALSTATAVSALAMLRNSAGQDSLDEPALSRLLQDGVNWLIPRQNEDGGWGDTDKSHSNISTTMLVRSGLDSWRDSQTNTKCMLLSGARSRTPREQGGVAWLAGNGTAKTRPLQYRSSRIARWQDSSDWSEVSPLPFELACLPQSFYRFVKMPVVSYAIPALVAVGQVIHATTSITELVNAQRDPRYLQPFHRA